MFVYRLAEPIDFLDGLTPLGDWMNTGRAPERTAWALLAILALTDAADEINWNGDMRHLPMVGCIPDPPGVTPYLVVKQDNNGDTFIVTAIAHDAMPGIDEHTLHTETTTRRIGAWFPADPEPDDPDY